MKQIEVKIVKKTDVKKVIYCVYKDEVFKDLFLKESEAKEYAIKLIEFIKKDVQDETIERWVVTKK